MTDLRTYWRRGETPPAPGTPPADDPVDPDPIDVIIGDFYEVQDGDTLSAIAEAWGYTVDRLASFNEIEDPDLIYQGEWLVSPDAAPPTADNTKGQIIAWLDVNGVDLSKKAKSKYSKDELLEFVASYVDAD